MAELKRFLFDNFVIEEKKKIKAPTAEAVVEALPIKEHKPEMITDADFEEYIPQNEQPKTYNEEEVAEKIKIAEQDAYERGFKTSQDGIDNLLSKAMDEINQRLMTMIANSSNLSCELEKQSVELAQAIIEKLVPGLNKDNSVEIVKQFISDNFNNFKNEAKLSFYIHPDIISYVQETIAKLANSYDFEGKISLHKDAKLGIADCRIEWENGGVERNLAGMSAKVENMLVD